MPGNRNIVAFLFIALLLLTAGWGCTSKQTAGFPGEREEGQSEFISIPWGGGRLYGGDGTEGGTSNPDKGGGTETRTIEEGDIYRVSGEWLYVLNQYRGLQVISLADKDNPRLAATVPIIGRPVEMYLRDSNLYIVVSDYFNCWLDTTVSYVREFQGSQLRIVSVADPSRPVERGGIDLKGFVTDSRIVGDVLYLVSNRYSYWYYNSADSEDLTSVYSVNVSDPYSVSLADQADFQKNQGYDNHVNVTENAVFIATPQWGWSDDSGYHDSVRTRVTYVDISDPEGKIAPGSSFDVKGYVTERWQMDFYKGVFRVVAPENAWGNGYPILFTYEVKGPNEIKKLASWTIPLPRAEAIKSTAYEGDRAYVVTYFQKDPLFTIDVSDPSSPKLAGELEMPGWLDFIEPRGDRLVALGHDDSNGENVLAVSAFDVSDIKSPKLLSRVGFGEGWGWVPGEKDDVRKVFRVLDDQELILVPFNGWSSKTYAEVSGVQIIDWKPSLLDPLAKRGTIGHGGWVERAIPFMDRVLTLSNEAFQVVDISDRDKPRITGSLSLARDSGDIVQAGGTAVELSGGSYGYYGDYAPGGYRGSGQAAMKLSAVPIFDPNTASPSSQVTVEGRQGRVFASGTTVFVTASLYENGKSIMRVTAHDYSDPAAPAALGSLDVPAVPEYYWYFGGIVGGGDSVLMPAPGIIAVMSRVYPDGNSTDKGYYLFVLDVSDPAAMRIASKTRLWDSVSYLSNMKAEKGVLFLSYSTPFQDPKSGNYYEKFFLGRIDLADPAAPKVLPAVNIPGALLGSSEDGRYIYTVEYTPAAGCGASGYAESGCYGTYSQTMYALALIGDKAYLRGGIELYPVPKQNEWYSAGNIVIAGSHAYHALSRYSYSSDSYKNSSELRAVDLSDPKNLRISSSQPLPFTGASVMDAFQGLLVVEFTGGGGGGIMLYSILRPSDPAYAGFARTMGHPLKVRQIGAGLYLPSGWYGVQVVPLR